ncbi:hypothetical protein VTL71DRAFT_10915 [Oculimacula yallundae]|uniref:Nucleoporin Nup54 alpha-helical domain-containing protein n=1 Tax=Oculimacula yallundae TaxID=86028 RepID=A0ABR4CUL8_9HELO
MSTSTSTSTYTSHFRPQQPCSLIDCPSRCAPGALCPATLVALETAQARSEYELDLAIRRINQATTSFGNTFIELEVSLQQQSEAHQTRQTNIREAYGLKEHDLTMQLITCLSDLSALETSLQQHQAPVASFDTITEFRLRVQVEQTRKTELKEQEQRMIANMIGALAAEDVAWARICDQAAQLTDVLQARESSEIMPMLERILSLQRDLEILKARISDGRRYSEEREALGPKLKKTE